MADPANPPVAGSKNLQPTDVNAVLPDRLAEHSGAPGSKMVDYTYANGQLAPGYTPTRSPNTQAGRTTPGGPMWGGESGPQGIDFTSGLPEETVSPAGTVPDRGNVYSSPKADQAPRDVNAPAVDYHTPVTSTGSNTPSWGGGPPPSSVQ